MFMKITDDEEISQNEKDNDDGVEGLTNEMSRLESKYSPQQNPHDIFNNHKLFGRYDHRDEVEGLMMPKHTNVPFSANVFPLKSPMPDITVGKKANESLVNELDHGTWRRMHSNYPCTSYTNSYDLVNASNVTNGFPSRDYSYGNMNDFRSNGVFSSMSHASQGFSWGNGMGGAFEAGHCDRRPDIMMMLQSVNEYRRAVNDISRRSMSDSVNNYFDVANVLPYAHQNGMSALQERSSARISSSTDRLMPYLFDGNIQTQALHIPYSYQNGMSPLQERSNVGFLNSMDGCTLRPYLGDGNIHQCDSPLFKARTFPIANTSFPRANVDAITREGSFIMQGEGLNCAANKGFDHPRGQRNGAWREAGFEKHLCKRKPDIRRQVSGNCEIPQISGTSCAFPFLSRCGSLADAKGHIYSLAKDQEGCMFLQGMLDKGSQEDIQVIFDEIIDHVDELMVNTFGNHLMQKLLGVCSEEQRMQIIQIITQEPWKLVKISLDAYGTRVVQRLIETLQPGQQTSLVTSALEPGVLKLINDLQGNHVIQRCLTFLSNEDKKFILVAAAMHCVEIATHQQGCFNLQKCIDCSSGEHHERLVAEISDNALLLAQDQYGNYVVQFILSLKNPGATACIMSQFEGHYVQLSLDKFSNHVVEKCLAVFDSKNKSKIIYELLSSLHFEQLINDPLANYVLQSAIVHSSGRAYFQLVKVLEFYRGIVQNSPYSRRIFSLLHWRK